MNRVGVMGGTFDPIHTGHLLAASEAADRAGLDEVLFIPSGQSWQKTHREISSTEHRVAMTALAIEADSRFTLSLMEVNRTGPSYTMDTFNELRRSLVDTQIYFIVGSDAIKSVASWHQGQTLIDQAHFLVMARGGHQLSRDDIPVRHSTVIDMPQVEISSSDIRSRVGMGRSVRYMVPEAVHTYIVKHQLYQ